MQKQRENTPLSVCDLTSGVVRNDQSKGIQSVSQNSAPKSLTLVNCEGNKSTSLNDAIKTSKQHVEKIATSSPIINTETAMNLATKALNTSEYLFIGNGKLTGPYSHTEKATSSANDYTISSASTSCTTANTSLNESFTTGKLTSPHSCTKETTSAANGNITTAKNSATNTPGTAASLSTDLKKLASCSSRSGNSATNPVVQDVKARSPGVGVTFVARMPDNQSAEISRASCHHVTSHSQCTTGNSSFSVSNGTTPPRVVYWVGTSCLSVPSQNKPKISSTNASEQSTQSDSSLLNREMKNSKFPNTKHQCDAVCQHRSRKPLEVVTVWEENNPPGAKLR